MARIAGIDIPDQKKVEIALRYIYGIGPSNALKVLSEAKVDLGIRVKDLTEVQLGHLQKVIEAMPVEGELRREVNQNIKRLEEIGTYRGLRHRRSLPVRGQRTKSNARTKRGKRKTIGTIRKEAVRTAAPGAVTPEVKTEGVKE
jgi:small subunit ribosomal protein S13